MHESLVICCLFDDSHPDRCEMILHCCFDLHFLIVSDVEHLSICLLTTCMSSLEKSLFGLCPFFKLGSFVVVELHEFFISDIY